jgi:hypothetical protein
MDLLKVLPIMMAGGALLVAMLHRCIFLFAGGARGLLVLPH